MKWNIPKPGVRLSSFPSRGCASWEEDPVREIGSKLLLLLGSLGHGEKTTWGDLSAFLLCQIEKNFGNGVFPKEEIDEPPVE